MTLLKYLYSNNSLRYQVVPPLFVVFFTSVVQFLATVGQGQSFIFSQAWANTLGNCTSWSWVMVIVLWAATSLHVPAKTVLGPETPFGYRPPYKDNGFQYFCLTLTVYLGLQFFIPGLSASIYDNFPQILGSFNTIALLLCTVLLIKGTRYPEHKNDILEDTPLLYKFYRGVELHPRVLGMDIKQLTNCRVGLMGWQIFITAFFFVGLERNGFTAAALVDLLLQTIYIGKFFWWEAGYFYTLDMMLDRAGFYICWGCLVWVPTFYTFSSYYLVAHPSPLSTSAGAIIFLLGITFIFLNYRVDYEKQYFRNSPNYNCDIWGKRAKFVVAEYRDGKSAIRKSALLTSGFWGVARHINYTFELSAAFCWCAPGGLGLHSLWPFLYFLFLCGLLIHRTIRDEDKCSKKYGRFWKKYCAKVPYRFIPYVW